MRGGEERAGGKEGMGEGEGGTGGKKREKEKDDTWFLGDQRLCY